MKEEMVVKFEEFRFKCRICKKPIEEFKPVWRCNEDGVWEAWLYCNVCYDERKNCLAKYLQKLRIKST